MNLRPFLFWAHLVAGVTAGTVIFTMCVTGVLLTYEKQILAWADSGYRSTAPAPGAAPLSMDTLVARLRARDPDLVPTAFALRSGPDAPVAVTAGARTVFVDRYSGEILGEASRTGARQVMSTLREVHRWLAVSGENRPIARAITGWSNTIFLFIVMTGAYLWIPRQWTARQLRGVIWFKGRLTGKARDFNWHNTIGFWSAVPLFIIVISAMPISFPWANALLFRAVGETPPRPAASSAAARTGSEAPSRPWFEGLDAAWALAERQTTDWNTITLRRPDPADGPLAFVIDAGNGGQPQLRATLTVDRQSASVVQWEAFADQSLGRRLRLITRFAHTGEVLGVPGQTVAGIVTLGGAVLAWTGVALAWRRFRSWLSRNERTQVVSASEESAA